VGHVSHSSPCNRQTDIRQTVKGKPTLGKPSKAKQHLANHH